MTYVKVSLLVLGIVLLVSSTGMPVQAAPFCALLPAGKQCFFTDAEVCKRTSIDGKCTVNGAEIASPDDDHGMHFCVVASSFGMQCIYANEPECLRAATAARGLCVNSKVDANIVWQKKMEADRQRAEVEKKKNDAKRLIEKKDELDRRRNEKLNKSSH